MQIIKRFLLTWALGMLLAIASLSTLPMHPVQAEPLTVQQQQLEAKRSARDIFAQAYAKRYTWDAQFPGYQAEVSVNDGGQLDHGLVQVKPDFQVVVRDIDDPEVSELVSNQLKMETIHRRRVPFDTRHSEDTYTLEGSDRDGVFVIREVGPSGEARYKVQDNKIIQVNRRLGDVAVTVDTLGFITPPEGNLFNRFRSTFRDPDSNEVLGVEEVEDFHEKIGNYYLLTNRKIRSSDPNQSDAPTETLIRFNNVQPLPRS